MSRGLGWLQTFIKEQIYKAGADFQAECDALHAAGSADDPNREFWLTWSQIRLLVWKRQYDISGPVFNGAALDRSAKRALHRLLKRGEVGRVRMPEVFIYMTAETYQDSFSPEAERETKAALERMASS